MILGKLSPKQKDVLSNSNARINIAHGSVRSGKTVSLELLRWYDFVESTKTGDLLMTGRTLKALERNVLRQMRDIYGDKRVNWSLWSKKANIAGREVDLEGADNETAQDKITGMTLAGALSNETSLHPESMFRQTLNRMSVPGAKFFCTTNPGAPKHWLKKEFIDTADGEHTKVWHFSLEDNIHLDPEYVDSLKRSHTGMWYDRYVLGKWVVAEGAVYDMFDRGKHVVKQIPQLVHTGVGIDYGTANPTVFYKIGMDINGIIFIFEEYRHSGEESGQKTDYEYAEDYMKWVNPHNPHETLVDPSALSFINALKKKGVNVKKANNDVLGRIRDVSSLLSADMLFIHESCTGLISEMESYSWDKKAQERGEDKPLKQEDHGPDAIGYWIHTMRRYWVNGFHRKTGTKDRLQGVVI